MNEDIKILREATTAVLMLRGRFPEQHERAHVIDDFLTASQPELLLRLLDDAERWQCVRSRNRNGSVGVRQECMDISRWLYEEDADTAADKSRKA
jgi:hypothetical protein